MKDTKIRRFLSSVLVGTCLMMPSVVKADGKIEVNEEVLNSTSKTYMLNKEESTKIKDIVVTFNDEKIEFDQQPIIKDGRTKVPFRAIFESMGTIVFYRNTDRSILGLTRDGDVIIHKIGTNEATINGEVKKFDSSSEVINDRTLIPVRMVAELLNAEVEWKDKERKVEIEKEITTNDYNRKIRGILECALNQNFNPEDYKRYLEYQFNNWDMDPKQVILNVNMDLDRELVEREKDVQLYNQYGPYTVKVPLLLAKEEDETVIEDVNDELVLVNKFNVFPEDYEPDLGNMLNALDLYIDNMNYWSLDSWAHVDCYLKENAYNAFVELNNDYANFLGNSYGLSEPNATISKNEYIHGLKNDNLYLAGRLPGFTYKEKLYYRSSNTREELLTGLTFMADGRTYYGEDYITNYKQRLGYELTEKENRYYVNYQDKDERYAWLQENSWKYGYVQRYPDDKEAITRVLPNYDMYRYVGKEVAKIMHEENLCLEEYWAKYKNPSKYTTTEDSVKKLLLKY